MKKHFLFLLLAVSLSVQAADLKVIVVRHAEKNSDGTRDPSLTPTGGQRAQVLAQLLSKESLSAIYATQYRRTQLTAGPSANVAHQKIHVRPAGESAESLAAQIRRDQPQGTVLVVGHSNTVPALVTALSGKTVEAIGDDEYDRYFIVTLPENGEAKLETARYPTIATPPSAAVAR